MNIIDTSFEVEYELVDVGALSDMTPASADVKNFSDLNYVGTGTNFNNEGTLEHNFFVLDGSFSEFENDPTVAFFSNLMSNANGTFTSNPTLTITFLGQHSSVGFTLYFADDSPEEVAISWYNVARERIGFLEQEISGPTQVVYKGVENYTELVFEFTKAKPFRYIKLNKILFGVVNTWTEKDLSSGTLVEENSMISDQLSINTLDFEMVDTENKFNLGNPAGNHVFIQRGQIIRPYEYIEGTKYYLGDYFIDTFSEDVGLISFSCMDYLGLLESAKFYKGDLYNGTLAGNILEQIFASASITNYTIDPEVAEIPMYGTIKPGTCREALREVLFACQATIDETRKSGISIVRRNKVIANTIERANKISTKAYKREYVSGVEVRYSEWKVQADVSEILSGTYSAGDNLIIFDSPYINITASTGTIIASGKYYCILRLPSEQIVQLNGKGYDESTLTTTYSEMLAGGEVENIKSFTSTLCNLKMARTIASSIFKYYTYKLNLDIQYLARTEKVLDWNVVENSDEKFKSYMAGFESITTDLTNGFVATAKLTGYYDYTNEDLYTGNELYCNDNFII